MHKLWANYLWNVLIQILPKRILIDVTSALSIFLPTHHAYLPNNFLLSTSTCDSLAENYDMCSSWVRKAKSSGELMSLGTSLSQWQMELEDKGPSFLCPQSAAIQGVFLHHFLEVLSGTETLVPLIITYFLTYPVMMSFSSCLISQLLPVVPEIFSPKKWFELIPFLRVCFSVNLTKKVGALQIGWKFGRNPIKKDKNKHKDYLKECSYKCPRQNA